MGKYKCMKCGYSGQEFIFQFSNYGFCVASNQEEPDYINDAPQWIEDKSVGDAEIGEPIGCPKCHAWGVNNFGLTSLL